MIYMRTTWLVMLRLTPRVFIGTLIVLKMTTSFKKRKESGVAQSESAKAAESNGQFTTGVLTKSEHNQVPFLDR